MKLHNLSYNLDQEFVRRHLEGRAKSSFLDISVFNTLFFKDTGKFSNPKDANKFPFSFGKYEKGFTMEVKYHEQICAFYTKPFDFPIRITSSNEFKFDDKTEDELNDIKNKCYAALNNYGKAFFNEKFVLSKDICSFFFFYSKYGANYQTVFNGTPIMRLLDISKDRAIFPSNFEEGMKELNNEFINYLDKENINKESFDHINYKNIILEKHKNNKNFNNRFQTQSSHYHGKVPPVAIFGNEFQNQNRLKQKNNDKDQTKDLSKNKKSFGIQKSVPKIVVNVKKPFYFKKFIPAMSFLYTFHSSK